MNMNSEQPGDKINATAGVHDEASPPKLGGGHEAW